jgi:hypothetical protein
MLYFITHMEKKKYEYGIGSNFEASFKKYNNPETPYELIILQNHLAHYDDYNKIVQVYSYLKSKDCVAKNDDDIFLYIDISNSLVMKKLDENIEKSFKESNEDIIFGANNIFKYIYPEAASYYENRYKGIQNKFLDFGFYIGYKRAIIQYFGFIMNKLMYYPKSDGKMISQRVIGYVFYQKDAKEHSSTNKALQNLKLNLDTQNKYFSAHNENKNIYELLLCNSYFLHFPDLDKQKQKASFMLVSKLKDL